MTTRESNDWHLDWNEHKGLVLESYSVEVINSVVDILRRANYGRIANIPGRRDVVSGIFREPVFLANCLWGSNHRLFSKTAAPSLYKFILELKDPRLNYFFRVMFLNDSTTLGELGKHFENSMIDQLLHSRLIQNEGREYRFSVSFVPFGDLIIVRDPFQAYVGDPSKGHRDRRVWLGADSIAFAKFLTKFMAGQRFRKVLEIGVGTGIQTLVAARHSDRAVGIDINKRALAFTRINAHVNGADNVEVFSSNLFEHVTETFDLILANPWYCDLKSGGLEEIPGILDGIAEHLSEDGQLVMLTSSYLRRGEDTDTVLRRLKEFVSLTGEFDLEAQVLGYNIDRSSYAAYMENQISHSLDYFVILRKGGTGKITRLEANAIRRARDLSYVATVKGIERVRRAVSN